MSSFKILKNFDYTKANSLSIEARQKLPQHNPLTLKKAKNIPSVSVLPIFQL